MSTLGLCTQDLSTLLGTYVHVKQITFNVSKYNFSVRVSVM